MSNRLACHKCGVELQQALIEVESEVRGKLLVKRVKGLQCPSCLLVDTYDWWREQAIKIRSSSVTFSGEEWL